uniref:P-type ATPase C-terminal domain-containing protein n=1 Tax=Podarcis muralis TaxID=64176 RepID=A0A670JMW3_PODMU
MKVLLPLICPSFKLNLTTTTTIYYLYPAHLAGFPQPLWAASTKTKNTLKYHTLKTSLNRAAFRCLLNARELFISLTSGGRAFHRAGATTEKALCLVPCSFASRDEGTARRPSALDLSVQAERWGGEIPSSLDVMMLLKLKSMHILQDVNEQSCLRFPKLYEPGQLNLLFNKRRFFICIAHGIYTSVVLFFIPYGAFYDAVGEDGNHIADYQSFAVTVATSLIIVVSVQIALDTSYWTGINHFFIWGSIAVYFAILFAMHSDGIFYLFPNHFPFVGNAWNSLEQINVWLIILLTTVASVAPVIAFRFLKVDLNPTLSDQVQILNRAQKKQSPLPIQIHQTHRASSRRSAYAFSHQEGFGELITSGKNMRVNNIHSVFGIGKTMQNSWIENLRKRTSECEIQLRKNSKTINH